MPPSHSKLLTIATYNIHSCVGLDGQFSPRRVAEVVRALDADIVALQEVGWHLRGRPGFDQFQFLREHTGYDVYEGVTKDGADCHFGNALLTRLPVPRISRLNLTLPYHTRRGAIDADVEVDGRVVRVLNAHLGLSPWERRVQVKQLIAAARHGLSRPTLLMGDLNDWRLDSASVRRLRAVLPHVVAAPTFHTRLPMVSFDRIYLSAEIAVNEGSAFETPLTRVASDHLPLTASVSVPSAVEARPAPRMATARPSASNR